MRDWFIDWVAFLFIFLGYALFCLDWLGKREPTKRDWIQMALCLVMTLRIYVRLFMREC